MEKQNKGEQIITKQPWVAPQLTILNVNLINQQAIDQEAELLNLLANDENAFRLFSGSAPSDYRLKEDIKDFDGLSLVKKLQAYHYAWINGTGQEYGVLAHELQAIFPYMVTGKKDEVDAEGNLVIQRVNYVKLIPILLKAVQEQQETINELKRQFEGIKFTANQVEC